MSLKEKKPLFKLLQNKRLEPDVNKIENPIRFITTKKIKIGPWNKEEDDILKKWVADNGPHHWSKCAKLIQERTGKQCRERWRNCLNAGIKKGEWTAEENLLILKLYDKYKSYKKFGIAFPGRTENALKNRFFIQLRKVALKNKKDHVSKIKLNELKSYYNEAVEKAEEIYFNRNKDATKEKFDEYLKEIENAINKGEKGNSFYLTDLRDKIIKNNYDSDSFSGDYEDEQKKAKEIEKQQKKELAKQQRKANLKRQMSKTKKPEKKNSKKKSSKSSKKSSINIENQTKSRLFSKNNLDFLYSSRYSFRDRNSTRKHLGDEFAFERPMNVNRSRSNLQKNNTNLNSSSNYLRGPSNYKSSFNIFNPSFNNSYFTRSKIEGSQFNVFNGGSGFFNDN